MIVTLEHSRILNNFAALHILTTRNMNPSPFVDWFFGGLNYQVSIAMKPPRDGAMSSKNMFRTAL